MQMDNQRKSVEQKKETKKGTSKWHSKRTQRSQSKNGIPKVQNDLMKRAVKIPVERARGIQSKNRVKE